MSEELYFNNELRKCLDAAGFSDCGENDQWNYWYQIVHKAHDQAVDRVAEVQRAENAKLRELLQEAVDGIATKDIRDWRFGKRLAFLRKASELGIEVEDA